MNRVYPDYLHDFTCLMGRCPDTCCAGWEAVIDPDTAKGYRSGPDWLQAAVTPEYDEAAFRREDGETAFRREDGRCAMLQPDGLCRIHAQLGEDWLCSTCRQYPLYRYSYGNRMEEGLCLSCPDAARLILTWDAEYLTEITPALPDPNDIDPELFYLTLSLRTRLLAIVRDRSRSMAARLGLAQSLSDTVCSLLHKGMTLTAAAVLRRQQPTSAVPLWFPVLTRKLLPALENMEYLTEEFPALLVRPDWIPASSPEGYDDELERIAVYVLSRSLLPAVYDGHFTARARLMAAACSILACLFAAEGASLGRRIRLAQLYAKELEHSEDNLQLLFKALQTMG